MPFLWIFSPLYRIISSSPVTLKKEDQIDSLAHSAVTYANTFKFGPAMTIHNPEVYSRMFLWCVEGSGIVTANGNQYRFTAGRFLILPWKHDIAYKADSRTPFTVAGVHLIPWYDPSVPYRADVAHRNSFVWWEGEALRDVEIPLLKGIVSSHLNRDTRRLEHLAAHAIELFHLNRLTRKTAQSMATLFWEELLFIAEGLQYDLKNSESARLERITRYVRRNMEKEISIEQLCDVGAVSRSTLRRLFVKSVGVAPYVWILQTRLERARYLLRTTSDSVSQISLLAGFQDPSYFVRKFHQQEGITPHRYRITTGKI
ncbi:MAG: helix-turn-helix transcriptional regulator [Bacteroidetes bacterium]|nr:helix-turn-helix transcriptional regulator [Bacteroidota bacterium]